MIELLGQTDKVRDLVCMTNQEGKLKIYIPYISILRFRFSIDKQLIRCNIIIFSNNDLSGYWSPKTQDENQWIGVEFDAAVEITAMQIQSGHNRDQWVKTYTVSYSFDGFLWNDYTNKDGTTVSQYSQSTIYKYFE